MDRYAILVDAGYFFAAGAQAAFVSQPPRKQVALKSPADMLASLCEETSVIVDNISLLRIYWYDAMPGPRLSLEQTALAMQTGVKLRLGALNTAGEQKGVDSLIVTDLIDLARNRAIADAIVVTGDEDLRIAVQVAQSFGVRVHILAVGDPSKNVSPSLRMEADSVSVLDAAWFLKHLELAQTESKIIATPPSSSALAAGETRANRIETAASTVIKDILVGTTPDYIAQLVLHFSTQQTVPPEHDRPLIAQTSAALSYIRFSGAETRHIRGLFIREVRARSNSDTKKVK